MHAVKIFAGILFFLMSSSCVRGKSMTSSTSGFKKPCLKIEIPDADPSIDGEEACPGTQVKIDDKIFKIGDSLGAGSFGNVYRLIEPLPVGDRLTSKVIKFYRQQAEFPRAGREIYNALDQEVEMDSILRRNNRLALFSSQAVKKQAKIGNQTQWIALKNYADRSFDTKNPVMMEQARELMDLLLKLYKEEGILITDVKEDNLRWNSQTNHLILVDGVLEKMQVGCLLPYVKYPGCGPFCKSLLKEKSI
jgi:hypothetical protein